MNTLAEIFILHEPHDLSWPLSGRILGKNVLLRFVDLLFWKKNKSTTLSNLVFYSGWLIRSLSYTLVVPTLN